jgi:hypothetical protein
MRKLLILSLWLQSFNLCAQVNGGEETMRFLAMPASPHISALGGIVVISPSQDIMMTNANPALLRPEFHTNLGLNYNVFYADTKISHLQYAHHSKKLQTTFGFGIHYVDYGTLTLTDAVGTINGQAKAAEYALRLTASKSYLTKWRYGATLSYAKSALIDKKAASILADVGIVYADTMNKWYVGFAVKNAGVMLKNYQQGNTQPLPLDVQLGVVKKFKKAPFSIMVLGHHLYTWDIRYNNPADAVDNQLLFTDTSTNTRTKNYFADKLFRHFVFAIDIHLGKRLELSAGYNHLRRSELALAERKATAGFSFGAGLYLNKFVIHYAQSYYHVSGPYNEIGINFSLNQLFGLGKGGRKINWSERFAREF